MYAAARPVGTSHPAAAMKPEEATPLPVSCHHVSGGTTMGAFPFFPPAITRAPSAPQRPPHASRITPRYHFTPIRHHYCIIRHHSRAFRHRSGTPTVPLGYHSPCPVIPQPQNLQRLTIHATTNPKSKIAKSPGPLLRNPQCPIRHKAGPSKSVAGR